MVSSAGAASARDSGRRRRQARRQQLRRLRHVLNGDLTVVALSAALAGILVLLAVPRFTAELLAIWSLPTIEKLQFGKAIPDQDRADAADDLDAAIAIDPGEARRLTDRGLIYLLEAEHQGFDTEAGMTNLLAGMKALERGLASDPSNSFAWARLAAARLARDGGPSPGALKALRMSYLTGPFVDRIMPFRAELSLRLWERLDADLTDNASRELTYLWGRSWADQERLMDSVCRYDRAFVLAQAVRESPEGTAEFDKLYPLYMTPQACRGRLPQH